MIILDWLAATTAVVVLILVLGHGARWMLGRARLGSGPARQRGLWRVAPDARVRAVEILGRVHLLYERGSTTTQLDEMSATDFDKHEHAESIPKKPLLKARVAKA